MLSFVPQAVSRHTMQNIHIASHADFNECFFISWTPSGGLGCPPRKKLNSIILHFRREVKRININFLYLYNHACSRTRVAFPHGKPILMYKKVSAQSKSVSNWTFRDIFFIKIYRVPFFSFGSSSKAFLKHKPQFLQIFISRWIILFLRTIP